MLFHKRVRNDDHCPICRIFTVSFHSTEAVDEDINEHKETLLKAKSLWIDEWVRRSNGDKYDVLPLSHEETYDLSEVCTSDTKADITACNEAYMFVLPIVQRT